jgi:hypothetical protein
MTRTITMLLCALAVGGSACSDDSDTDATGGTGGTTASAGGDQGGGAGGAPMCLSSESQADCTSMCEAAIEAPCGGTQAECEESCQQLNDFVASCPAWGGLVDCMGDAPTFTCIEGEAVPEGCEGQFFCLSQCFD